MIRAPGRKGKEMIPSDNSGQSTPKSVEEVDSNEEGSQRSLRRSSRTKDLAEREEKEKTNGSRRKRRNSKDDEEAEEEEEEEEENGSEEEEENDDDDEEDEDDEDDESFEEEDREGMFDTCIFSPKFVGLP